MIGGSLLEALSTEDWSMALPEIIIHNLLENSFNKTTDECKTLCLCLERDLPSMKEMIGPIGGHNVLFLKYFVLFTDLTSFS